MADTNFSLIDLKALSEPACKLIEAVKDAVGILYEPTRLKRIAKAEVAAAIIKLEGEEELKEVALRAADRIKARELRRQQNIESVVTGALQELPEAVSDEPVNEDWVTQFFDYCQDVRDEEMQSIWSKLLAGEVTKPGAYSLRTLHTVKLLRKDDAGLFTHFCNYVWKDTDDGVFSHIGTDATTELLKERGITVVELLHLQALGLVAATFSLTPIPEGGNITAAYFGRKYSFTQAQKYIHRTGKRSIKLKPGTLDVQILTAVGTELAPICGASADEEYLETLEQSLLNQNVRMRRVEDI